MNFDYYSENQLYVSRFPDFSTEEDLYKLFSPYGKIKNIMMKPGFAFIDYENYNDADDCVFCMDGLNIEGKRMIVQHASNYLYLISLFVYFVLCYVLYELVGDKKEKDFNYHTRYTHFNKKNDCCYHCGKKGHWAKECREDDFYEKRSSYCFKCGDKRHVARFCPKSHSSTNRVKSKSESNNLSGSRSRSRNRVEHKGHKEYQKDYRGEYRDYTKNGRDYYKDNFKEPGKFYSREFRDSNKEKDARSKYN